VWADIVRDKVYAHCNPRSLFQGDRLPKRLMCVNWGWSLEAICIRQQVTLPVWRSPWTATPDVS
jgi:hypothetical protein